MIRKVPNLRAWVLKPQDVLVLKKVTNVPLCFYLKLPIFETRIGFDELYSSFRDMKEDYVCAVDTCILKGFHFPFTFTLEEVEAINKTWDKFYYD